MAVLDRNRNALKDFKIAERFPHVADLHRRHLAPSSKVHDASCAATVLFFSDFTDEAGLTGRHCRQFVRFWQFGLWLVGAGSAVNVPLFAEVTVLKATNGSKTHQVRQNPVGGSRRACRRQSDYRVPLL